MNKDNVLKDIRHDDEGTAPVVVLGLGNILLGDEGAGVRAVEYLQREYEVPSEVEVVDGGTAGIDLLPCLRHDAALIIVDAIKPDQGAGTILRFEGKEVPSFLSAKLSPHQIGLPDLIATAELVGRTPRKLILLGIEPATLETGTELSPAIQALLPTLVERVVSELQTLGIVLKKKLL